MGELYSTNDFTRQQHENNDYRSPFRRDYARLIHSPAFRRLQGKTQLFPCAEIDFFRNRLTHSLEVAQIAKSITQYINIQNKLYGTKNAIDEDLVEFAGLAHDLGHPPFGHNGERALDDCMKSNGGYEGNAQTLRILTKIEKKVKDSEADDFGLTKDKSDKRFGLNITYRSIASILKYDTAIKKDRTEGEKVEKGYYYFDEPLVKETKRKVVGDDKVVPFKTIECLIMELADDIAYSTYDLEDAFKAGFCTPLEILCVDDECIEQIHKVTQYDSKEIKDIIRNVFISIIEPLPLNNNIDEILEHTINTYKTSDITTKSGYVRIGSTSSIINSIITEIIYKPDPIYPQLSKIELPDLIKKQIEILKHYTYFKLINSPIMKVSENRGYDIVTDLFKALIKQTKLLPSDFQYLYNNINSNKERIVCDFIAGMTDRYAVEFFSRLYSENPETIFKPL